MEPVPLLSLWMPILVSAVFVFIVSSIIHMVLPYHRSDYKGVPSEDQAMEALRKFNIPPGDYVMPFCSKPADRKSPAFAEKMKRGPVAFFTVLPTGPMSMGPQLVQWFLYSIVISLFGAYLASRTLVPGAAYLEVSQIVSTVAFVGYAMGHWPQAIWYKRSLSSTVKHAFDGLIYGFVTGGVFGWLWPAM